MDIKIKKIGEVLADSSINIDKNLLHLTAIPFANTTDPILRKIERAKKISYIELLRNLSYKMNARKVKEGIEALIKMGLIAETKEQSKVTYHRTEELLINTPRSEIIVKILTNQELEQQANYPIKISGPNIWAYKNNLLQVSYNEYWRDEEISLRVKHYVLDQEKEIEEIRNQIQFLEQILEKKGNLGKRESIPEHVKIYVWRRDTGQCVQCGNKQNLEFDHIIPVSKGGNNTERNIQILCGNCNRKKSNKISLNERLSSEIKINRPRTDKIEDGKHEIENIVKIKGKDLANFIFETIYKSEKISRGETMEKVYTKFEDIFKQNYHQFIDGSGLPRWQHKIDSIIAKRRKQGFIKNVDESERGVWELTFKGIELAKQVALRTKER